VADQLDLRELWNQVQLSLMANANLSGNQLSFARMLKPVALVDGSVQLHVSTDYAKQYIERHCMAALTEAIDHAGALQEIEPPLHFSITVAPTASDQKVPATSSPPPVNDDQTATEPQNLETNSQQPPSTALTQRAQDTTGGLNQNYTFETFVIGPSNRFAHAAAMAVADAPGKAYNPLFIYGGSGLGKTHLLHAIGLNAAAIDPRLRIHYTSSEEFTNIFINAIREKTTERFQRHYRDIDVLLIDDIQFLQGKEQTVEEFFHTFNALYKAEKQIVITSDVPPKQLDRFEDRLRSRFEWGLMVDVQPPDLETRIAILRHKASRDSMSAPDDVLAYIASRIHHNIRELEGALIRVTAYAGLNHQQVDRPLAEVVLREILTGDETTISASLIIAETAKYFSVTVSELSGPSRSQNIAHPRQLAMYLCRELTELSLIKIGNQFGGRDHSTVLHAERKVRTEMERKPIVFQQVTELTRLVKQAAISR
jgi:chromosomal replication initiator protein